MMQDTNILTPGRGFSLLGGHVAVMSLMRRAMLVTAKQTPETVEKVMDGATRESLDHSVQQKAMHEGMLAAQARFLAWTPGRGKPRGNYVRLFKDLARSVFADQTLDVDMRDASRSDLYRMTLSLCQTIDEHDDGRAEWYPTGWRGWYDLVTKSRGEVETDER